MRTAEFSHKVFELPRPIAFVFSGGSCLGALHVGMLRAVREAGIEPDLLVGTSVGAFNAAFVGAGFTPSRVAALEDIWRSLRTRDVFTGLGWRSAVWALTGSGTLASPAGLRAILDRHLPSAHADLAISTAAVAVDLATGNAVALRDGDLRRHVLASAAIPGIFPPVEIDGRIFVDGGVAAHVPLVPAKDFGARTMVVFDTGFP